MIICGRVHEEIDTYIYILLTIHKYVCNIYFQIRIYIYTNNQWKKDECKYHKGNPLHHTIHTTVIDLFQGCAS